MISSLTKYKVLKMIVKLDKAIYNFGDKIL